MHTIVPLVLKKTLSVTPLMQSPAFSPLLPSSQGRYEVYFLETDPIFLPKILIPDRKNDENFDP